MAIFRCNKCTHLQEHADAQIGTSIACPKCGHPAPVYGAVFFIGKLLDRYFAAQREINRLKAISGPATVPAAAPHLDDIDLGNTDHFASELQHGPIYDWFSHKQIKVQANMRGVDTSGFFDEVALAIGGNLPVLKEVLERLRWAQQKEYSSTTIHLDRKSPADAAAITVFCQQLYDFSFVAKCFHNRPENNIRLILQTAPTIRDFFNGEWLEWYALMTCLTYARERRKRFSCARNLSITLANGDSHELDVFLLIDGNVPICIECKTGEFRQSIDKYLGLRKRLGIDARNFIMCITGLADEQASGLSAMYDLTFVSERNLASQLTRLF
ncbi:MAG: hypothetical protein ACM3X0_05270 [Bacteroidota bacterium]